MIVMVLASLFLVLAIGAYLFCYSLLGKSSAEAARLAGELRTKSQDSLKIAAAKTALGSLVADEARVREYLVPTNEIVPFLESLERTGRGFGATVEVVSVSADTAKERGNIKLSLRIAGPFDSVLRTLGAIEYGAYDSRLTGLVLDTSPSDDAAPAWSAAATFDIGTRPVATTTRLKP